MRFLQLNMKKAFVAAVELSSRLEGKENFACLVTEPYRYKEKIASLPPGVKALCSKKNARAAIFYKGEDEIMDIETLTNPDCAVGLLKHKEGSILVASVYLDINKEATPGWLAELCNYADGRNYPLILGMDSNAHSVLYLSLIHI